MKIKIASLLILFCSWAYGQKALDFMAPANLFSNITKFTSASGTGTTCSLFNPCSIGTAISTAVPGDVIGCKANDIYLTGDLVIAVNNLHITSYGTGSKPKFDGRVSLSAATWTNEGSGFYSTPMASDPKWVFINDISAHRGESSWLTVATNGSNTVTVTGSSLTLANSYNGVQSLTGAKVRFKQFDYRIGEEEIISSYSSGIFTFASSIFASNTAFRIYEQAQFCTSQGDWYYDSSSGKLFVKSTTSPSGTNISYSSHDNAISATSKSSIKIDNLAFTGYYRYGLKFTDCNQLLISDNDLSDIRGTGIQQTGDAVQDTIRRNSFSKIGLNGLEFNGFGNGSISMNTFTDIGMQLNYGWPESDNYPTTGVAISGVSSFTTKHVSYSSNFDNNTITNTAYAGMLIYGEYNHIFNNKISVFDLRALDGGGIHTFWVNTFDRSTTYNIIENNHISGGVGDASGLANQTIHDVNGIYIDNRSEHNTVRNNYVSGNKCKGILFNFLTANNTATGNIVENNLETQVYYWENTGLGSPTNNNNNLLTDNFLITRDATQKMVTARTDQNVSTFNPFSSGGDSYNKYFPYLTTTLFSYQQVATVTTYDLPSWITKMGKDATSTIIANSRRPVVMANPTTATVNISLTSNNYTDVSGAAITGITLGPFESKVCMLLEVKYKAVLDAATTAGYSLPSTNQQRKENEMVIGFIASGFWDSQDVIYRPRTDGDANYAKLNYKNPGVKTLTVVGTVNFVSGVGFKGDGSTGYLTTGYSPSVDGVNCTLNNCAVSFYSSVNEQHNFISWGASDANAILGAVIRTTSDQSGFRINHLTSTVVSNNNSSGFFEWKRTGSAALSAYRQGTLLGTGTNSSISLVTTPFDILNFNANGSHTSFAPSTKDFGFFSVGSSNISGYSVWSATQ